MTQAHQSGAEDVFTGSASVFAGGAFPQNPFGAISAVNATNDDPYVGFLPMVLTVDYVPATLGTGLIATAANPANGVAMTLHAGTGITLSGGSYYIDGVPAANPTTDISKTGGRVITVTGGNASATGGTVLITGLDLYGNVQTQLLTVTAGTATSSTTKAFKAVTSVVPQYTDTYTIAVGIGDVFGFPILSSRFQDVLIYWNATLISASTGYLAGVTTSPSTNLLGDTRGTYATQSASDASKRLTVIQAFRSYTSPTMLGVTPV